MKSASPLRAADQRVVAAAGVVVHLVGVAVEVVRPVAADQRVVAAAGVVVHDYGVANQDVRKPTVPPISLSSPPRALPDMESASPSRWLMRNASICADQRVVAAAGVVVPWRRRRHRQVLVCCRRRTACHRRRGRCRPSSRRRHRGCWSHWPPPVSVSSPPRVLSNMEQASPRRSLVALGPNANGKKALSPPVSVSSPPRALSCREKASP